MLDQFSLEGKIAVVTGAARGLGADSAIGYAEAGADVALLDLKVEEMEDTKSKIEALGKRALSIACDVSDEESVKAAVAKIIEEFSTIDILLNNAGICPLGDVEALSLEAWEKTLAVNLTGDFLVCKYVLPIMREKKYGKVVNTSSLSSIVGDRMPMMYRHAYNATKAGVRGLTIALATRYAPDNITVNAIAPGCFASGMAETFFAVDEIAEGINGTIPMRRPGNKDELKGVTVFLSSDASSYITGQCIYVDGGSSVC